MIAQVAAAITGGLAGNAMLLAGAAAEATDSSTNLAPWAQGIGSGAAVAGLVYVARMIIKGDLVPRAVASREDEMVASIRVQADREAKAMELAEDCIKREKHLADLNRAAVAQLAEVRAELANVREVLRGTR